MTKTQPEVDQTWMHDTKPMAVKIKFVGVLRELVGLESLEGYQQAPGILEIEELQAEWAPKTTPRL